MTFIRLADTPLYGCVHADTKATTGIDNGAKAIEFDTGDTYIFDGASWNQIADQNMAITAASLPLPSGASTSAKQPALGTAGTPSADVISVQGVSGGTVLPVVGDGNVIAVTPTVSASPDYSIGDAVGGKQTLANAVRASGGQCLLESIQIIDNAGVKPVVDILFFDSDPSAATITDNSAFAFSTDKSKCRFRKSITTSDYCTAIDSTCIANITGINQWLKASGSTSLYVAVVAQATINLAATNDLRFDYGVIYQ